MEDDLAARKATEHAKTGRRGPASRHQLRVDRDQLYAWMAQKNIASQEELAAFLGLGAATAYRACNGKPIGEEFVSALGKKVAKRRLGDFFLYAETRSDAA